MARLNIFKRFGIGARTHEGAPARHLSAELELRRSVLACLLWEKQFYEDGVDIAGRIAQLVPKVEPARVAALAGEARERMHLRHAPLFLVREMARHQTHRALVGETLCRVIQRADELTEFVAIYWKDGRVPLSAQVKKGLAAAFTKFDGYQLAKYDRPGPVKLRDVLFLCHAKPKDLPQEVLWQALVEGKLAPPDTWEVALSAGGDKRTAWERLLAEGKLGALALVRNLRNMQQAGVREELVLGALRSMKTGRVLPFRFLAAARHAPQWEPELEQAMLRSVAEAPKLAGTTVLLVDVSGSMVAPLSARSEMLRTDAAYGLAVLLREVCEKAVVYTFSDRCVLVPARRGFALRDALDASQEHRGTYLGRALDEIHAQLGAPSGAPSLAPGLGVKGGKSDDASAGAPSFAPGFGAKGGKSGNGGGAKYDRIIVITDEQAHDRVPTPRGRGYLINVASYKHGVGYGRWTHIDGWSESVVDYIRELEQSADT